MLHRPIQYPRHQLIVLTCQSSSDSRITGSFSRSALTRRHQDPATRTRPCRCRLPAAESALQCASSPGGPSLVRGACLGRPDRPVRVLIPTFLWASRAPGDQPATAGCRRENHCASHHHRSAVVSSLASSAGQWSRSARQTDSVKRGEIARTRSWRIQFRAQ